MGIFPSSATPKLPSNCPVFEFSPPPRPPGTYIYTQTFQQSYTSFTMVHYYTTNLTSIYLTHSSSLGQLDDVRYIFDFKSLCSPKKFIISKFNIFSYNSANYGNNNNNNNNGSNSENDLHFSTVATFSVNRPFIVIPFLCFPIQIRTFCLSKMCICAQIPYVGIMNLGLTCYVSASLQFLSAVTPFVSLVLNTKATPKTTSWELQRVFGNLKSSASPLNIMSFVASFGSMLHEMVFREQDAHEFMTMLFDKIDSEFGKDFTKERQKIFCVKSTRIIKCKSINKKVEIDEDINDIDLPVLVSFDQTSSYSSSSSSDYQNMDFLDYSKNVVLGNSANLMNRCFGVSRNNIMTSLDQVTMKEEMKGKDKWDTGDPLFGKQEAVQYTKFKDLPPFLTFHLMRFTYNETTLECEEVKSSFDCHEEIDMKNYILKYKKSYFLEKKETKYKLMSIIAHRGSLSSGHYVAYMSPKVDDHWFLFNDSFVTVSSLNEVKETFSANNRKKFAFNNLFRSSNDFNAYVVGYVRTDYIDEIRKEITAPVEIAPLLSNCFSALLVNMIPLNYNNCGLFNEISLNNKNMSKIPTKKNIFEGFGKRINWNNKNITIDELIINPIREKMTNQIQASSSSIIIDTLNEEENNNSINNVENIKEREEEIIENKNKIEKDNTEVLNSTTNDINAKNDNFGENSIIVENNDSIKGNRRDLNKANEGNHLNGDNDFKEGLPIFNYPRIDVSGSNSSFCSINENDIKVFVSFPKTGKLIGPIKGSSKASDYLIRGFLVQFFVILDIEEPCFICNSQKLVVTIENRKNIFKKYGKDFIIKLGKQIISNKNFNFPLGSILLLISKDKFPIKISGIDFNVYPETTYEELQIMIADYINKNNKENNYINEDNICQPSRILLYQRNIPLLPNAFSTALRLSDYGDLEFRQLVPPATVESLSLFTSLSIVFADSEHNTEEKNGLWFPKENTLNSLFQLLPIYLGFSKNTKFVLSLMNENKILYILQPNKNEWMLTKTIRLDILSTSLPMHLYDYEDCMKLNQKVPIEVRTVSKVSIWQHVNTIGFFDFDEKDKFSDLIKRVMKVKSCKNLVVNEITICSQIEYYKSNKVTQNMNIFKVICELSKTYLAQERPIVLIRIEDNKAET